MVCNRCIKLVGDELNKLNHTVLSIELGEVEIQNQLGNSSIETIRKMLIANGFELIEDKKSQLIDKIKTTIIELIHYQKEKSGHINISNFLSKDIGYDYSYLSNSFSTVEGTTIEKYVINQKIEKAKELLVYDELSLNEISYQLGYSSVQHLSNQFKKITGLSPSHFKKLGDKKRKPLDEV